MKKLRRGLHDLSPLFHSADAPVSEPLIQPPTPFDVQFLSVCVPEHEGDAFLANAFLASQIVRRTNLFASLVSVVPGMNAVAYKSRETFPALELLDSRISRLSLSHQELWSFTKNGRAKGRPPLPPEPAGLPNFLIFLEFEPVQFRSLAQIALLLDRVILFLQPDVESLREGYRVIKILWSLNREIEFFLLFRGERPLQAHEGFLFERFSLITSRFLGISPGWLGNLGFPGKNGEGGVVGGGEMLRFHPEPILAMEGLKRPLSPEKNRCWQALRGILTRRFQPELLPAAR